MLTPFVFALLTRWLSFLALAVLLGGLLVDLLVLPGDAPGLARVRGRLRSWRLLSAVALFLAGAGEVLLRAQTMAGGDLASATAAIPAVLGRTHFGTIWIARLIALGVVVVGSLVSGRLARGLVLLSAMAVALTTSLTGHAGDWGDLTVSAGMDWLHVLSTSAWTGGLICLALVVLADIRSRPPELLGAVTRRFSRFAAWGLAAVVLTGSYNAWIQLVPLSTLWTTPYGRVLAVKLLTVLALVWWGAVNRYSVVPRLAGQRTSSVGARLFRLGRLVLRGPSKAVRSALPSRLGAYVRREALLAVVVFGFTAALVDLTPARHAGHAAHHHAAEHGPFRVTMAELHESGGIPKGWIFTPPAGDASRGRQIFVRLGCFACHTVSGEDFPRGSGVGPDLADVGEHHPAGYLFESIINPNAVIIQGPGYTGPDGRSIMPDFRDRLSAGDLVDLVAYLVSLAGEAEPSPEARPR